MHDTFLEVQARVEWMLWCMDASERSCCEIGKFRNVKQEGTGSDDRSRSSLHSVVKSHRNLLRWADTIHNQMFSHYQTTVDWNGNIYAVEAKSEEKADDVHKE